MRIEWIEVENFKRFSHARFELHPQMTLFAGDNGSGKTSVLDALAVAAGIWLVDVPDSALANSRREIYPSEIRLEAEGRGDRLQFREHRPVRITACGQIGDRNGLTWTRQIRPEGRRTSNVEAKEALGAIQSIYQQDAAGGKLLCPVLAYYGAGRAWLPSAERRRSSTKAAPARRWDAFYDCFNERIRFSELHRWFRRESIERGQLGGAWRPGFGVVRSAILACVPGADDCWFDGDRDDIVLQIDGKPLPFSNLSAGQSVMLALVADIAIKAVTQNSYLLDHAPAPELLGKTPGVVLIDELDVHLHPTWQRQVVHSLRKTFPAIQFVCTSHSPQVIGEMRPEEIRMLDGDMAVPPAHSFGVDSNRVLEEVMSAPARNPGIEKMLTHLFELIDQEDLSGAEKAIAEVARLIGPDDPELTRARTMISFLGAELR